MWKRAKCVRGGMMEAWVVISSEVRYRAQMWMQGAAGGLSPVANCARCVTGEDEMVEWVMCERYEKDRREMMQMRLSELGHNRNESWEDRERMDGGTPETMSREMNERMTVTVKAFVERMWHARCRDNYSTGYCYFLPPFFLSLVCLLQSCWSKGLAQAWSWPTFSIKIKMHHADCKQYHTKWYDCVI